MCIFTWKCTPNARFWCKFPKISPGETPRKPTCGRGGPLPHPSPFGAERLREAFSFIGHFCPPPPPAMDMFWIRPVNNRGYILSMCVFPRSSAPLIWRVLVDFVYIWKIWHSIQVIRFILPARIISNQKGLHEVDNEIRCQYTP